MNEPKAMRPEPKGGAQGAIFVVDDEAMLLELAMVILQPLHFPIRTFSSPLAALSAFRAAQPRPVLLITDYAMPGMNGLALMAACRQLEPDLKILLISGTVDADIYENSDVKPNAFLAKPYQARQLVEMVESILER